MKYEVVIGLEVHTELSTKTKIFCNCTTAFGGEPNTHVCPVCAGMPGTLPVLNRAVVEYAMRTGLALNCDITRYTKFDRKNYFYPDLPKAYQISQLYLPSAPGGMWRCRAGKDRRRFVSRRSIWRRMRVSSSMIHLRIARSLITTAAAYRCWRLSVSRICVRRRKRSSI